MRLNETLDRLAREREAKERAEANHSENLNGSSAEDFKVEQPLKGFSHFVTESEIRRKTAIQCYAEKIFFQRMLKDINNGMSEPKIEAMIERSIMIATKLFDKIDEI